jgi:cytochrome c
MKLLVSALALAITSVVSIASIAAFAAEPAAQPAAAPAASGGEALVRKYACIACHSTDKKLVGPAYKDVAAKYRDNKDAERMLIEKVKKGGSGVWGTVPMPANPSVPDGDLQEIIKWILALK